MSQKCSCGGESGVSRGLISLNVRHLSGLSELSNQRLTAVSKPLAAVRTRSGTGEAVVGPETHIHLTAEGDSLATTSFVDGQSGDLVVRGVVAGIPCELHIGVALDGAQLAVTLHLTKPIEIGPYTWRFNLGGIVRGSAGQILAATGLEPVMDAQPAGLGWWCALKCGGAIILPTLAACLPALSGGPAAYVACVTGKLGAGDAAAVAVCIARKCV